MCSHFLPGRAGWGRGARALGCLWLLEVCTGPNPDLHVTFPLAFITRGLHSLGGRPVSALDASTCRHIQLHTQHWGL